jgi:hypothetical protein
MRLIMLNPTDRFDVSLASVSGSPGDDRPDIAGIEGSPLDPWQREIVDLVLG